jgi:hypothetical protein
MANLMLSVMGAFAEFERALIGERQRGGHHPGQGPRGLPRAQKSPLIRAGRGAAGPGRRGGAEDHPGPGVRHQPRNPLSVPPDRQHCAAEVTAPGIKPGKP